MRQALALSRIRSVRNVLAHRLDEVGVLARRRDCVLCDIGQVRWGGWVRVVGVSPIRRLTSSALCAHLDLAVFTAAVREDRAVTVQLV